MAWYKIEIDGKRLFGPFWASSEEEAREFAAIVATLRRRESWDHIDLCRWSKRDGELPTWWIRELKHPGKEDQDEKVEGAGRRL